MKKIRICDTCSRKAGHALKAKLTCILRRHRTYPMWKSLWEQDNLAAQRDRRLKLKED